MVQHVFNILHGGVSSDWLILGGNYLSDCLIETTNGVFNPFCTAHARKQVHHFLCMQNVYAFDALQHAKGL